MRDNKKKKQSTLALVVGLTAVDGCEDEKNTRGVFGRWLPALTSIVAAAGRTEMCVGWTRTEFFPLHRNMESNLDRNDRESLFFGKLRFLHFFDRGIFLGLMRTDKLITAKFFKN